MSAGRVKPQARHCALAVWMIYSLVAHGFAFALWAGPSATPPGTPQWLVWAVVVPHVVNGLALLAVIVYGLAEALGEQS